MVSSWFLRERRGGGQGDGEVVPSVWVRRVHDEWGRLSGGGIEAWGLRRISEERKR